MIVGFNCNECGVQAKWDDVIEHFSICESLPLPMLLLLMDGIRGDTRHNIPRVTTTSIMNCPREILLRLFTDVYTDPEKIVAPMIGTKMHAQVGRAGKRLKNWITEDCTCPRPFPIDADAELAKSIEQDGEEYKAGDIVVTPCDGKYHIIGCDKLRCTFVGEIEGVPIGGQVDALEFVNGLDSNVIRIHDWKFRSSWKAKDTSASSEDICQMNINRILAEQNGYEVAGMCVGHVPWSTMKNFNDIPIVDWDMIAAHRAYPGQKGEPSTLGENLHTLDSALNAMREPGARLEDVLQHVPFVGDQMFRSGPSRNKCKLYCSYHTECYIG